MASTPQTVARVMEALKQAAGESATPAPEMSAAPVQTPAQATSHELAPSRIDVLSAAHNSDAVRLCEAMNSGDFSFQTKITPAGNMTAEAYSDVMATIVTAASDRMRESQQFGRTELAYRDAREQFNDDPNSMLTRADQALVNQQFSTVARMKADYVASRTEFTPTSAA